MSDRVDERAAAARAALRQRAEELADSNRMLRDITEGTPVIRTNGQEPPRNGLRLLAVAAALIAIVVGGLFVLRDRNDESERPANTDAPVTTLAPVTTVAVVPTTAPQTIPPSTVPESTAVPTSRAPSGPAVALANVLDMTFVDAVHGWALIQVGDTGSGLVYTADGGVTWASTAVDTSNVQHVVFANATRGWMYGGEPDGGNAVFKSTKDGGQTWTDVDLGQAGMNSPPVALATDGTSVSIIAAPPNNTQSVNWVVATAPVDSDAFVQNGIGFQQGAGPANAFSLATDGGDVWAVYNDRTVQGVGRVVAGATGDWNVPWSQLGGSATLSASRGGVLYAGVWAGEWTGPTVEYQLFVSTDRGNTFNKVTLPTQIQNLSPVAITPVSGNTVLLMEGTPDGTSVLYRSTDAGATWAPVQSYPSLAMAPVRASDGSTLVALQPGSNGSTDSIWTSADGGATWAAAH